MYELATNATAIIPDIYSQLQGFGFNLAATLIGVFVGFGLAFWWDRRKQAELENQDKIQALKAIKQEFEFNMKGASSIQQIGTQTPVQAYFSTSAYQSAVASGTLTSLSLSVQKIMIENEQRFRWVEEFSKKILSMVGSAGMALGGAAQTLANFDQAVRIECDLLASTEIPKALKLIDGELEALTKKEPK